MQISALPGRWQRARIAQRRAYLPLPVSSSARAHPLSFTLPLKRLQKHRSSTTSAAESDDSGHQQPGEPDRARFNQENSNLRSVACSDDAEPLYCPASEDDKSVSFVRWRSNTLLSMDDYEGVDLAAHQQHAFDSPRSWLNIRNQVQLSTYGNHIGENMNDLYTFLETRLKGVFGGVHLLPIYPSSGDGGFAPLNYKEITPEMGSWKDFEVIASEYDVTAEFMVNHISPKSTEFQDFLEHGWDSKYADMFINWDTFWPEGRPTKQDLALIRTRKPGPPVLEVKLKNGETARVWCTFGTQQIDINPFSKFGKQFVTESLESLGNRGAKMVRLDAFGYATKKLDTRCFMEEPEATQLLDYVTEIASESGIGLLCEVHEEYQTNIALAKNGFWVYDFALPLLLLHAVTFKTAVNIRQWLRICPRRQITVLDTHDGMGIDDIEGIAQVVEIEELRKVVTDKLGCAPNFKYHYSAEEDSYIGAPHQYNCTYYSALRGNARDYLLCRVIQFFTPGIPMVYYVGLFAGRNDWAGVDPEEGNTRAINRHRYSIAEADEALQQPVVQALLTLCKARNTHPAFNGQISVPDAPDEQLVVQWENGPHKIVLDANLQTGDFEVTSTQVEGQHRRIIKYTLDEFLPDERPTAAAKPKAKVSFRDA